MLMNLAIKIPQEYIFEAYNELKNFKCLRKEVNFKLFKTKWSVDYTCGRYGNGYSIGFICRDSCKLRITDLDKCRDEIFELDGSTYTYLVQDEFFLGGKISE